MIRDEFAWIAKKIESVYRPICPEGFTDLQFEEWWQTFGNEDYSVALRAYEKMKKEYGYFPMVSTFRSYIDGIKEIDESAQKESETPIYSEPTSQDMNRHIRWMRFIQWIYETKNYPKTSEETSQMKIEFEKKHPNWKPKRKRETGQPVRERSKKPELVKDILEDVFKELPKEV